MPDYRRYRVPGGNYFFTVNLLERRLDTLGRQIEYLREAVRGVRQRYPFHIDTWVVLPDHLHCNRTLSEGDADVSTRGRLIKTAFANAFPLTERRSAVRVARHERAIWQRRFWGHAIRDERDYERHMDYVHYNPVKHSYVERIGDWPHSTFQRYVAHGIYPPDGRVGLYPNWKQVNACESKRCGPHARPNLSLLPLLIREERVRLCRQQFFFASISSRSRRVPGESSGERPLRSRVRRRASSLVPKFRTRAHLRASARWQFASASPGPS
jgi:putative transposase